MGWFATYSGHLIRPIELEPKDVRIGDIAHALSLQCRFAGHCREFYSVAQHSVLVSRAAGEYALWGLLHDAAEAYLVDIPRPVKHCLTGYKELEARIMEAIAVALGLRGDCPGVVRFLDKRMLAAELRDLFSPAEAWPDLGVEPWPETVEPWRADEAEREFLARFNAVILKKEASNGTAKHTDMRVLRNSRMVRVVGGGR